VLPRVGAARLVDLTPQRVQALYVELLERGKKDGSPLSARSVLQVHRTLHRALGDAVRWRLLARNPAHDVRLPRAEKKEMTAWVAEDARAFLAGTADDRLAALWMVALHSGMRRGELAGLRWADVDLDAGTIAVTQQRTTAHYKVVVAEPKARSRRVIPVDATVVEAIRSHRRRQLEERLLAGAAWADSGYVLVDELGVPYHPERLGVLFERSCRTVGVPPIRLHDLRHTMATAALQAGIHPKVVQERLGHSSIAVTLDTYSHVAPTLQREAADKIGRLFAP